MPGRVLEPVFFGSLPFSSILTLSGLPRDRFGTSFWIDLGFPETVLGAFLNRVGDFLTAKLRRS